MKTLLIKDGTVVDGTGSPAFTGHVLICDDRIKSVLHAVSPPKSQRGSCMCSSTEHYWSKMEAIYRAFAPAR